MEKFRIKIQVTLKPSIKDIKAITVENSVKQLMPGQNIMCRTGNIYSLEFEAENKLAAEKIANEIAEEILSNSVIEEYEIIW